LSETEKKHIKSRAKRHLEFSKDEIRERAAASAEANPDSIVATEIVRESYYSYYDLMIRKFANKSFKIGLGIWLAAIVGFALWFLIGSPNLYGEMNQASDINAIWPNIWKSLLVLVGIVVVALVGAFVINYEYLPAINSVFPKGLGCIFIIYLVSSLKATSGYFTPYVIIGIICLILSITLDLHDFIRGEDEYKTKWGSEESLIEIKKSKHKGLVFFGSISQIIPI
jgi:hypothetical protein